MLTDVQVSWLTLLRLPTCTLRVPILKICNNMPSIQKIDYLLFSDLAISKDGCAVLLYHTISEDDIDTTTCLQY